MEVWHITPSLDLKKHQERTDCECEPKIIIEGNSVIVVHNSYDGREGVEWANEILNVK